jgi:hypothetical protein
VATDTQRLSQALATADFPADKDDLVRCAETEGADHETVSAIRAIPPVSYANFDEVLSSVSTRPSRSTADEAVERRIHTKPGLSQQDKDLPGHPISDELGENRDS